MLKKNYDLKFKYACLISLLIGGVIFFLIFVDKTSNIINPFYTDWIKNGSVDLKQHYWGWLFFKNDNWSFPFGMFENLSYPNKISIIYTDSIPLVAIVFKFILKLFNYGKEFQYLGLWGLLCYMLQSFFGFLISRKFIKSNFLSLISGSLFCFVPAFVAKMFLHTALASHWVILSTLSVLFWADIIKRQKLYKKILIFSVIGILSSGIHMYFIPMCGLIIFAYCMFECLNVRKNFKNILCSFMPLLVYVLSCLITLYLEGAFVLNLTMKETLAQNYGYLNYESRVFVKFLNEVKNNAPFNSDMLGFFMPGNMSILSKGIYIENSCWLGFGIVFLIIFSLILPKKQKIIFNYKFALILLFLFLTSYIIAILPELRILNHAFICFCIPDNSLLGEFLSIFRFNSRFNFLNIYLILIFAIFITSKLKQKITYAVLIFALLIQIVDLSGFIKQNFLFLKVRHINLYSFEKLNDFTFNDNVIITSKFLFSTYPCDDVTIDLCEYAFKNNLKLTNFYFARTFTKDESLKYFKYKIKNHQKGDVFVFSDEYCIPKHIKCSKKVRFDSFTFCEI